METLETPLDPPLCTCVWGGGDIRGCMCIVICNVFSHKLGDRHMHMHALNLSRTVPRLAMMIWGEEQCGKVRRRVYATKVAQNLELAKALNIQDYQFQKATLPMCMALPTLMYKDLANPYIIQLNGIRNIISSYSES